MSSSSSSWSSSSFGGGGSGPGSGSGSGTGIESSSASNNGMWIWIGNESCLFKKMAPLLLHCGSAGSSSTTTTTTTTTSSTTQRYYRFNAWYPRMGGTCSLNDIYPVKTKKTKKCASLGNAHQTLSQQPEPEPKPELEPQAEAEAEPKPQPEPVYFHSNGTNNDTDSNSQVVESGEICIKDLPDMILIEIFRLLHPVDRIHCISLVCKHWNNLLYSSNIWTYVRLIISPLSSATNTAAKIFLSRISNSVEKLCLSVPENEEKCSSSSISTILEDILPDRLPKLKLLDIGHFPELTPNVLRKIDSCVPNLQQLNMEHAFSAQCYEVLFSREYLQNIRQLILCGWGLTAHKIETLLHAKPKLEVLSADEASNKTGMHSRNWKGFDEPIRRSPLQRLYVRGLFRPLTLLRELQNFKHLTLLSFTYMGYMGPEDVYPVRSLSSLEHLHMSGNYDDYSRMTSDCLRKVFASPQNNDDFPSKLKFLSIPDWVQLDDSVIQQLTISCPHLRSLCIARCPMVSREGFLTIGSSLRELQLLDISEIISKNEHIQFPADILCSLVYLHAGPTHKFAAYRNLMFKKPSLILCTSLEQLYVDDDQDQDDQDQDDQDEDECQNSYSTTNYNYTSNSNSNSNSNNSNSNKFITTNNRHHIAAIADELARIEGFCCMSPILL